MPNAIEVRPWQQFSVGSPSDQENWENTDCRPLGFVKHVAHSAVAADIVRDKHIRAGLIFDQCKLNQERIQVTWLSPNHWAAGFRYGNVCFSYSFSDLIADKRFYWVESIAYGVPACRILLSNKDWSHILEPYDPTVGDGPWWHDRASGIHYWNGNYCLEILYEGNLNLARSRKTSFVDHHRYGCNIDTTNCPDLNKQDVEGGAEFICRLFAQGISSPILKLTEDSQNGVRASRELTKAVRHIVFDLLNDVVPNGEVRDSDEAAIPLARSVLGALSRSQSDAVALAKLFATGEDMQRSVLKEVATCFSIDVEESLVDYNAGIEDGF